MGIGISLAGGGLKGIAHIGALKALDDLGLDIDYITGTSSGGMVAALYVMGFTPNEMCKLAKKYYKQVIKIKKLKFLKSGLQFGIKKDTDLQGILDSDKIEKFIETCAKQKEIYKISDIKKPFAMITADSKTTRKCVLSSRKLEENENMEYIYDIPIQKAVHASMAFPAIFAPCKFRDYSFIDGGTVDNLPVETLKNLGATKTISLSFKLDDFEGTENLFSVILRACDIFSLRDVEYGRKLSDIDIPINLENVKLLRMDDLDASIKIGYDTVMKNKEKILEMVKVS